LINRASWSCSQVLMENLHCCRDECRGCRRESGKLRGTEILCGAYLSEQCGASLNYMRLSGMVGALADEASRTIQAHIVKASQLTGKEGCATMAGEAVAWFEIRVDGDNPYSEYEVEPPRRQWLTIAATHGNIEICGNEQFILGRDPELWYGLCIPTVACCDLIIPQSLLLVRRPNHLKTASSRSLHLV
jgi:hypothetical protein